MGSANRNLLNFLAQTAQPIALIQGEFPNNIVTPTRVSQTYLNLANILKLPTLKTNMTLTKFRASIKLDLTINLNNRIF